jgi:hypothetical protein
MEFNYQGLFLRCCLLNDCKNRFTHAIDAVKVTFRIHFSLVDPFGDFFEFSKFISKLHDKIKLLVSQRVPIEHAFVFNDGRESAVVDEFGGVFFDLFVQLKVSGLDCEVTFDFHVLTVPVCVELTVGEDVEEDNKVQVGVGFCLVVVFTEEELFDLLDGLVAAPEPFVLRKKLLLTDIKHFLIPHNTNSPDLPFQHVLTFLKLLF